MRKILWIISLSVLILVWSVSAAPPPNFSGTWELDRAKTQTVPRPWEGAESVTMIVTQNDKQVTLETKVVGGDAPGGAPGGPPSGARGGPGGGRRGGGGMMGPATYNLDGTESTTESERGKTTTKASWSKDGGALELSVKRVFPTPNGEATSTSTDKLTLSSDGKMLTDTRHSESQRGTQDYTLVFNKKS